MKTVAEQAAFSALAALINGVVWRADPQTGRNTFVSDKVTPMLGYTREQWTGSPHFWESLLHPEDRARVLAQLPERSRQEEPYSIDYRLRHADGHYLWLRDLITPVVEDGQLIAVGGVTLNVTDQKLAEDRLRAARDRFERVFAASPVGMVLTGMHTGRVIECNDALLEMHGCTRDELIGSTNDTLNPWVDLADRERLIARTREGAVRDFETRLVHFPTGEARDVLISTEQLDLEGEEVLLMLVQDISDRKRAEAALKASESRFRALVQNSSDLLTVVNRGGYLKYASPSMSTILGYDNQGLLGQNVLDFMHPDEHAEIRAAFAAAVLGGPGATARLTSRFRQADGAYRWLEWVATNHVDHPQVQGVVMNSRDVSERMASEQALEESRRTFEVLFEASPDSIMLVDFSGDMPIVNCNEAAASMKGYAREELIGLSTYVTLPDGEKFLANPAANEAFRQRVRAAGRLRFEAEHRRKDGTVFPVDIHLALLEIGGREMMLSIERDISERRAADAALKASQERLLSSEKLAGLGRLTAGLAHEINTPLAATMNELHEASRLVTEYRDSVGNPQVTDDDHREIAAELAGVLEAATRNTTRIGDFIRKMRSHTRDTVSGRQAFDAVKGVGDTLAMLAHEARAAKVDLLFEQPREGVTLTGEPGRFTQVVTNLVVNAIHACTPGCSVTVRFADRAGRPVMEVEDNGSGIPPEVLPRIFEPMFTTKDVGKGTGLGLSIIHDIITGHFGAEINVRTELGRGTTFEVVFPAPQAQAAS
ncbi:PAS domain S-box protein [Deinococcus hohokamensis]|uniref:histidine kinase n=1 Tax=Deinococcus hohokamensis TaxID=309883 RepID=A0ABV9I4Q8_9DEIO